MIRTIITHACSRCGSTNMVKNGRDYKGTQKFHCKACNRYGTVNAQTGYDDRTCQLIYRAVCERLSLRGIEHTFGISRRTVSRWLRQWCVQVPPLRESLVGAQPDDVLELDELWSFVGSKARQRWLWLALCRRTRLVVAYWLSDRYVFDHKRHRQVNKEEGETTQVERWLTPYGSG